MRCVRPLAIVVAVLLFGPNAIADDTAELRNLKERLDAAKNEVFRLSTLLKEQTQQFDNMEAEMSVKLKALKEENEFLRLKLGKNGGVFRIPDLLKANTNLIGDYEETSRCECTLSIKEIYGKNFKGSHTVSRRGKTTLQCDVEGTFFDDKLAYKSVNSSVQFTVTGNLRCDTLEIEYADNFGTKAKGVLKLAK